MSGRTAGDEGRAGDREMRGRDEIVGAEGRK